MPPTEKEILEDYTRAEELLKELQVDGEGNDGGIPISLLNELRYAGQHLARALADSPEKKADHLRDAHGHIKRALHDSAEIGILFWIRLHDTFRKAYEDIPFQDVLRDASSLRGTIRRAREAVRAIDNDRNDRDSIIQRSEKMMVLYREVKGAVRDLMDAEDDFKAIRKRDIKAHHWQRMGVWAVLLSAFIAAFIQGLPRVIDLLFQ